MRHFLDDDVYNYGVKEILDDQGIIVMREKVDFDKGELSKLIDQLVDKLSKTELKRQKPPVTLYGERTDKEVGAPFVRYIGIDTSKIHYLIYKTEEDRDKYYNSFN